MQLIFLNHTIVTCVINNQILNSKI